MNLGGFLQNVGLQMGYNEIYGVQQGIQKTDLQLKQLAVQEGQMKLAQQAQIMQVRQAIAKESQTQDALNKGKVQSPMAVAAQYDKDAQQFLAVGDMQSATQYQQLATSARQQAKDAQVYAAKEKQGKDEDAAKAALAFKNNPNPSTYGAWTAAMTRAGQDTSRMPATLGDFLKNPGAGAAVNAATTLGESSKDVIAQQQKQQDFELKRRDQQEQYALRRADTQAQRAMTAAMHEETIAMQKENQKFRQQQEANASADRRQKMAEAKDNAAWSHTQTLVDHAQQNAAPDVKQYRATQELMNLVSVGGSASDKQVMNQLATYLANAPGRSTNLYFTNNKAIGDLYQRTLNQLQGFLGGTMSPATREAIRQDAAKMRAMDVLVLNAQEAQLKDTVKARVGEGQKGVQLPENFPRLPDGATEAKPGIDANGNVVITFKITGPDGKVRYGTMHDLGQAQ